MTRKETLIISLLLKISREKCTIQICRHLRLDYHDTHQYYKALNLQTILLRNVLRSAKSANIKGKDWMYTAKFNAHHAPHGVHVQNNELLNNRELFKHYRLYSELDKEISDSITKKREYLQGEPIRKLKLINDAELKGCEEVIIKRGYDAASILKGKAKQIKSTRVIKM